MSGFRLRKKNFWFTKKQKKKAKNYWVPESIKYRTSMGGGKPDPYVMPEMVIELGENIEEMIDEFLENADINELNSGAFLDEYIDHVVELGRNHLKQQAYEHQHMIEAIQSVERGELLACMSQQREIRKEIDGDITTVKEETENEEIPKKHIYKEIIA